MVHFPLLQLFVCILQLLSFPLCNSAFRFMAVSVKNSAIDIPYMIFLSIKLLANDWTIFFLIRSFIRSNRCLLAYHFSSIVTAAIKVIFLNKSGSCFNPTFCQMWKKLNHWVKFSFKFELHFLN